MNQRDPQSKNGTSLNFNSDILNFIFTFMVKVKDRVPLSVNIPPLVMMSYGVKKIE